MRKLLLAAACCSVVFAQVSIDAPLAGPPYSAEQIYELTGKRADGTQIKAPPVVTKIYRDSQARTRTENSRRIDISDPIAGYLYRLDSAQHVAHRTPQPSALKPRTPGFNTGVKVQPAAELDYARGPKQPEHKDESLGTQIISGVMAEGRRYTLTYAPGSAANDQPIVRTDETWYSPELEIVLLSKTSDPRWGESITRIENLTRAEPDLSLFQVPPDYEIVDEPLRCPSGGRSSDARLQIFFE